jgi:hypothetical protein
MKRSLAENFVETDQAGLAALDLCRRVETQSDSIDGNNIHNAPAEAKQGARDTFRGDFDSGKGDLPQIRNFCSETQ